MATLSLFSNCVYQQSVLVTYLPKSFPVETIGPTGTEEITCAEILDARARFLFQEKLRRSLHEKML
jgi:hypothetical protein